MNTSKNTQHGPTYLAKSRGMSTHATAVPDTKDCGYGFYPGTGKVPDSVSAGKGPKLEACKLWSAIGWVMFRKMVMVDFVDRKS